MNIYMNLESIKIFKIYALVQNTIVNSYRIFHKDMLIKFE